MAKNPCFALAEAGTAVWLDQLSRALIRENRLQELIAEAALTGVTSNPAIFQKAMMTGDAYDEQIRSLKKEPISTEELYERMAIRDIQAACEILRPVWEQHHGKDGFVSLEVSPHLARDSEGTLEAARRLHAAVGRSNCMIKIPGTPECLPAIESALFEGIPINVTLLFAVPAYEEVAWCYIRAMAERAVGHESLRIPSVASFFVSRLDTLTDSLLEDKAKSLQNPAARDEVLSLRGKTAVANAKIAYQSFRKIFCRPEFVTLEAEGAWIQRPLWASTSTKNPAYSDVLYVEPLVGRQTVNTMPAETLDAFMHHGRVRPDAVEKDVAEARAHFERLEEAGISVSEVTDRLLQDGIQKFSEPYDKLLACLEEKRRA